MKPKLSLLPALREMFYLWMRNFWIVTLVAFATGLPQLGLTHLADSFSVNTFLPGQVPTWFFPLTTAVLLTSLVVGFILTAVATAAILGVLSRPATEPNPWPAMRRSIAKNIWTLCRLYLLLTVIAMIPGLIMGMILATLKATAASPVVMLFFVIYLIMIKYALADPLVVKEGMGARAALKRSWQMTRGAFWYVLGCYLCLVAIEQLLHWLFASTHFTSEPAGLSGFLFDIADEVTSPLWIIVSWVMYNQIKAKEPEPAEMPAP